MKQVSVEFLLPAAAAAAAALVVVVVVVKAKFGLGLLALFSGGQRTLQGSKLELIALNARRFSIFPHIVPTVVFVLQLCPASCKIAIC